MRNIPTSIKNIGGWAKEIIDDCSASLVERRQMYGVYRNVFLTGDPQGDPQTYLKTFAYIDALASFLYSPVDLRFSVEPYGQAGPRERALGRAAASVLLEKFRNAKMGKIVGHATLWSLVKGKCFVQLLWSKHGFEPHLVQPDNVGVLRDDVSELNKQDAFFHRRWITPSRFADLVHNHSRAKELMKNVTQYMSPPKPDDGPDQYATTRMVMLGGLYPYQVTGTGASSRSRGLVDWLSGPKPTFAPKTLQNLIPLDELWVWDSSRDDWITVQLVGPDCVIEPSVRLRNVFAEYPDPADNRKTVRPDKDNPLTGHHPFVEFCPNDMGDGMWSRSEICNVGALQTSINKRIDGINRVLRKQEDPPKILAGFPSINQNAYAKLNKPGGYLTEQQPTAKAQDVAPAVGSDMWNSLHEFEGMMDDIGGFPPVTRGRGESGVRAQGHAETLVRMASPRFKDRALDVEGSVEELGGLGLDLLKARDPEVQVGWVKKSDAGPFASIELDPSLYEPPAPGLHGIVFRMSDLMDNMKVSVDAHSASPAFSHDARQLVFDLNARQALRPKDLVEATNPPHADNIISDIERREAEQAAFAAQHPDLAAQQAKGKGKHH